MRVTKKPKTYRAFEFTGDNRDEIQMALVHTAWKTVQWTDSFVEIYKEKAGGIEKAKALHPGWYVVVSTKGKVWVCNPAEFQEDWDVEVEGDED